MTNQKVLGTGHQSTFYLITEMKNQNMMIKYVISLSLTHELFQYFKVHFANNNEDVLSSHSTKVVILILKVKVLFV